MFLSDTLPVLVFVFVSQVTTVEGAEAFLRSNRWQTDPLSLRSPGNAICSRADLDPLKPTASGGIDTKVSSYR